LLLNPFVASFKRIEVMLKVRAQVSNVRSMLSRDPAGIDAIYIEPVFEEANANPSDLEVEDVQIRNKLNKPEFRRRKFWHPQ
jgi:hypothetical protein